VPPSSLSAVLLTALVAGFAGTTRAPSYNSPHTAADALSAIVGEWQSDTVDGVSAQSHCAWTPQRGAVLCEQRIDGAPGVRTAINLFTADSASGRYALYVLVHQGDTIAPLPIVIRGKQWFYGGEKPARDGIYYRTVNDFSQTNAYTWRQESSADGKEWKAGSHGQSRRLR
jgi:hypothetical protein